MHTVELAAAVAGAGPAGEAGALQSAVVEAPAGPRAH